MSTYRQNNYIQGKKGTPRLTNKKYICSNSNMKINLKIPLKIHEDIGSATETFSKMIQEATWESTSPHKSNNRQPRKCPAILRTKFLEKRRQKTVTNYNGKCRELKE